MNEYHSYCYLAVDVLFNIFDCSCELFIVIGLMLVVINYKLVNPKLINYLLILCEILFLLVNSIVIELQQTICCTCGILETCGKITLMLDCTVVY